MEDFRSRGLFGDFYFDFVLRDMPRRGADRTIPGRLWGSRNDRGPIFRIELAPNDAKLTNRLLIQSGEQSAVWRWTPQSGAPVQPVGVEAIFAPLAETRIGAFDLQMPYLYWSEFVFEGVTKVRGRPAHAFLCYPPTELAEKNPQLTGVRAYVDTQFHALIQAEYIGEKNEITRTVSVMDFKKVGEQWIPKSIDVRDEKTRDKTRFLVTAAALGLDFTSSLFAPASLDEPVQAPARDRLTVVGP